MSIKMETKNNRDQQGSGQQDMVELKDITEACLSSFRDYAKANPETVAMWCLGIGFVLGWKLRPW